MKAKKPLVLAALVLALLALALILPTVASGASGNPPVNWATWGNGTANRVWDIMDWQGQSAFNVRELSNGDFEGFALFQSVRHFVPGTRDRASSFEDVRFDTVPTVPSGPLAGLPYVTFVVKTEGTVWVERGVPPLPTDGEWAKVYAIDGGPHGIDYVEMWFDYVPSHDHSIDSDDWSGAAHIPFGPTNTNVEIHLGG